MKSAVEDARPPRLPTRVIDATLCLRVLPPPRLSTAETPPLELRRQTPCSPVRVRLVFNGPSQFGTGLCALAATLAALCEARRDSTGGSSLLRGLAGQRELGCAASRRLTSWRAACLAWKLPTRTTSDGLSAQCPSRRAIQRQQSCSRRLPPSLSPFPIWFAPRLSASLGADTSASPAVMIPHSGMLETGPEFPEASPAR